MTGRHEFKNGVTHTINERERMALATTTLAQVLKSAGYTTGIFGKWHLGDEPDHWPSRRGFDEMFIHGAGGIGQDLMEAIRKFYYSDVSAILLMIIATVVVIDMVTEHVRHALLGREAPR